MQTLLLLHMDFGALRVPVPPLVLAQQAVPGSPHLAQFPALHRVPGAVQAPVAGFEPQQVRPSPPQVPHAPALQIPPPKPMQLPPTAMQIPVTQQPPLLQPLPSQHCVPGSPQTIGVLPPVPPCAEPATSAPPTLPPLPSPPVPMGKPASSYCCTPPSMPGIPPPQPWVEKAAPPANAKMHDTKNRLVLVTGILLGSRRRGAQASSIIRQVYSNRACPGGASRHKVPCDVTSTARAPLRYSPVTTALW
jgi:hypothetical protein